MPNIVNCPHCRTLVYDTAPRCHGCEEPLRRRRRFRRGTWAFTAFCVGAFTLVRGIDLLQDRRDRVRREIREEMENEVARTTAIRWLTGDDAALARTVEQSDGAFLDRLKALRDAYPDVFPAESARVDVVGPVGRTQHVRVLGASEVRHPDDPDRTRLAQMAQTLRRAGLRGAPESDVEYASLATAVNRQRCACSTTASECGAWNGWATVDGKRVNARFWDCRTTRFVAVVERGEASYRVHGTSCHADGVLRCLVIRRVERLDGELVPPRD
ncbi:MAG TPA: hypothetical protein VEI02_10150 [Planctomycetota bacterium]|nr:hypothetical protein [Planctomycetota bacterium]